MSDQLDERIKLINESLQTLGASIEVQDAKEGQTVSAALTLAGIFLVSLSEIADSVGKIARQTEQEFSSQVDQAAEIKATEKANEQPARRFFGKPSN
jgi:hypothetical protein